MKIEQLERYINTRMNTISVLLAHALKINTEKEVAFYVRELAARLAQQVEPYREQMLSMAPEEDKQDIIKALDVLLEIFPGNTKS